MISKRVTLLLVAMSTALTPAARAQLDPTEERMVAFVDAHVEDALELLQESVDINSGTMNFDGVREVGRIFARELDRLGFETRWVDGADFGRAGHLVAERVGEGGPGRPKLVLIGHLDTVFELDSPFQRYEPQSETHAKGPGTTDMKGGIVVMIQALAALRDSEVLDRLHLVVVLMGDEEKSGRPLSLARAALVEAAQDADAAIGFEDGDSNPETAVISRRGSSGWELRVTGVPAHSSQVFREDIGAGAIYEASRILLTFYEELRQEPNLTFNPGLILGGTEVGLHETQARGEAFGKSNVVAETAVVRGDLRALSPEQYERARETMRKIVADGLPQTRAEITFSDGYPPMAPSDGNRWLLERYDRASRDLGFGPVAPVDPLKAGAADVSFVAPYVPKALDGIGLMGDGGHTVDEVADLTTLPSQTKRAAVLLYRLSTELRDD